MADSDSKGEPSSPPASTPIKTLPTDGPTAPITSSENEPLPAASAPVEDSQATPTESSESSAGDDPTPSYTPSPSTTSSSSSQSKEDPPPTLEQARIFLRDESVQSEPRPRKAAFLASKGLNSAQIDQLLGEEDEGGNGTTESNNAAVPEAAPTPSTAAPTLPPIVTYPEFIARPPQPPPLVTPNVFLSALYSGAAVSTLLYTTARLVLAPMVDALTASREELHSTAATNLTRLLDQLETAVSEIPEAAKAGAGAAARRALEKGAVGEDGDDDVSNAETTESYDDPTEVFHRDIGVQTSLPPSPALAPAVTMDSTVPNAFSSLPLAGGASAATPTPSQLQAERLTTLVDSVRSLSQGWAGPADVLSEIKTTVDVFREDVDKLTRPPAFTYGGGGNGGMYSYGSSVSSSGTTSGKYPGYVTTTRNEPDDEIRKAKENIRRVKGALLSTRTFPTAR